MKKGCRDCEQWMEHCYWDHDTRTKKFLKTLTGNFSTKLKLPTKFSNYFKEKEMKTVQLKGPSGEKWNVGMIERKETLYLVDGWDDFVHGHNLEENDTLHFEYEPDTGFNVLIFDESGCEKVLAYHAAKGKCRGMEHEGTPRANKYHKGETSSSNREGINFLFPKPEPVEISEVEDKEKVEHSLKRIKKCVTFPSRALGQSIPPPSDSDTTKAKALELAHAFEPKEPSFVLVMRKSSIPPTGYNLVLNIEFGRKYMWENNGSSMKLRIPGEEKDWKVSFRIYSDRCLFTSGWIRFARDNSLELGDVLVFELVGKDVFDVHIFRA